jgi:hypothetical protein
LHDELIRELVTLPPFKKEALSANFEIFRDEIYSKAQKVLELPNNNKGAKTIITTTLNIMAK